MQRQPRPDEPPCLGVVPLFERGARSHLEGEQVAPVKGDREDCAQQTDDRCHEAQLCERDVEPDAHRIGDRPEHRGRDDRDPDELQREIG